MSLKLTEEELNQFQSIHGDYLDARIELGDVSQRIEVLTNRKKVLHKNFELRENAFESFRDEIVEKYKDEVGSDFNIDLRTGKFIVDGQD